MKQGQVSIEFLSTYGWVILAIAVIFGALWQFGIINPKGFKTDSCIFDSGISCKEIGMKGDFIHLILVNGFRQDITPQDLGMEANWKGGGCNTGIVCGADLCGLKTEPTWQSGSKRTIKMKCPGAPTKARMDVSVNITYIATDFGKYTKTAYGNAEFTKTG